MIQLHHFLAQHPHGSRLRRRRDRRLGAIRANRPAMIGYAVALTREVVSPLRAAGLEVARALKNYWPAPAADRARDARPPVIKHEIGRVRATVTPRTRAAAPSIAARAVKGNVAAVDVKLSTRIKASLGIQVRQALLFDQAAIATTTRGALHENVQLITSIDEDYFEELEDVLADNWANNGAWADAVSEIEDLGDVTQSRAELIARDQTMKMNSRFNEARQTSIGVKRYEWVTVGDDRVRDAHVELDGSTQDWDEPPTDSDGNTGHAGDCGVNDRCAADPILDLDQDDDAGEADADPDEELLDDG